MRLSRTKQSKVRVLIQDQVGNKINSTKSFTLYETSLDEVFTVVRNALEAEADVEPEVERAEEIEQAPRKRGRRKKAEEAEAA